MHDNTILIINGTLKSLIDRAPSGLLYGQWNFRVSVEGDRVSFDFEVVSDSEKRKGKASMKCGNMDDILELYGDFNIERDLCCGLADELIFQVDSLYAMIKKVDTEKDEI